ncbi:MAG: twin-arginine translocase TatA/TatE family subunit [Candidatus Omnitrophica bacterium]|nr:twin-arginine translocase TatA/TatE family subunit [Candidatus Omnitrophota bacterium]
MFGIGLPELLVILLVCLLLFGANRLPEIGKSLGDSIREFKKAMKDNSDDDAKPKTQAPDKKS